MNELTPEFLIKSRTIFKEHLAPTLQDVRLRSARNLTGTARRDALSALDTIPRLFKIDLATISATWPKLRTLFGGTKAAELGLSEKRYANIRSEVIRAVKSYGIPSPLWTKRLSLTTAWAAILTLIDVPDYCSALRRLACYCSAMNIEPTQVDRVALLGFYEALEAEEVLKDPRAILRNRVSYWNMQVRKTAGWPQHRLSSPFERRQCLMPLSEFPISFQQDVAKWRNRLLEADILDFGGPTKSLRLVTVELQTKSIQRFASTLVRASILRVEDIRNLSTLVQLETARAGLKIFVGRAGGKSTGYVRQYAWLLLSIARHYCKLRPEDLKGLSGLVEKLNTKRQRGMTARNRAKLAQFDDPAKINKLLTFPEAERACGLKVRHPYRRAKYFERALSAAILRDSSIRMDERSSARSCLCSMPKTGD